MAYEFELTILIGSAILAGYFYFTRNFKFWEKKGVKYEPPTIFFGNIFEAIIFRKSQGEIIFDIYKKYQNEKVVGMFNLDYPALLVRDPDLVHKVFVTDFNFFADNDFEIDENDVLAKNMFAQKGETWKHTRQALSPAFTISKVKAMFDQMKGVGEKLKTYVSNHPEELELKTLMAKYTSEIVASCGLGIDGHSFTSSDGQLTKLGRLVFEPSVKKGIIQLAAFLAPTFSKIFGLKFVPDEVPEFFNGMLRDIIRHRQTQGSGKSVDMMQYWIDLKKKSEEVMKGNIKSDIITKEFTDDDILNGCITFFIEGYETSSNVTSFVLHYLAKNKDVQNRVKEEIDQILNENNGELTFEGVTKMPYLDNVILESLRLHPVLYHSTKRVTKRYAMDIGGKEPLILEPGTSIILPTKGLHTDPKYWDDPEKFDPDRLTEEAQKTRKKGVFMPFGDGPRVCIGMRMAMIFIKVGIATVLKEYEIVPSPKTPQKIVQDPRHFLSFNLGGLHAKFVKRK